MTGPLSGSGAMVLLHDPGEVARMRDLAYAVSPGSHTLMAVKYREVIFSQNESSLSRTRKACYFRTIEIQTLYKQQRTEIV